MRLQRGRSPAVLVLCALGTGGFLPASQAQTPMQNNATQALNLGQSSNGLNGISTVAGTLIGVDDRSRSFTIISLTVALEQSNDEMQNARRQCGNDARQLAADIQPILGNLLELLNRIENWQAFILGSGAEVGGDAPLFVTSVVFSNGHEGYDLGAEWIAGGASGYGIAGRVTLNRRKLTHDIRDFHDHVAGYRVALQNLYEQQKTLLKAPQTQENSDSLKKVDAALQEEMHNAINDVNARQDALAHEYLAQLNHVQLSAEVGFRGLNFGDVFNYGLSLSYIRRLGSEHASGLVSLVSLQGVEFFPRMGGDYLAPLAGIALAWQDHVAYLQETRDKNGKRIERLKGRWRVQTGIEYDFQSLLGIQDSVSAFVRWRTSHDVELDFSGGETPTHRSYVGFGFSTYFRP